MIITKIWLVFFACFSSISIFCQSSAKVMTMEEAVSKALADNPFARNAELKLRSASISPVSAIEPGNTKIDFYQGMTDGYFLKVSQDLGSPISHIRNIQYQKQLVNVNKEQQKAVVRQLTADVKKAYTNLVFQSSKIKIYHQLAPVYDELLEITGVPYGKSDSSRLTQSESETLFASFQNEQYQAEQEYTIAKNNFLVLLNSREDLIPADTLLELYAIQIKNLGPEKFEPAGSMLDREYLNLQDKDIKVEESKLFPALSVGYFNQRIDDLKGLHGIYLGASLPLWFFPQSKKITEAKITREMLQNQADYQKYYNEKKIESMRIKLDQLFVQISFFRENSLKRSEIIINDAIKEIRNRNFDYPSCMGKLQLGIQIQQNYLEKLKDYNETAIDLESCVD